MGHKGHNRVLVLVSIKSIGINGWLCPMCPYFSFCRSGRFAPGMGWLRLKMKRYR
jgi:hypothetical protein